MRQTITKSDKNLKILNKLVENGFYEGYIRDEKFELMRIHLSNNYRLIGILNESGSYDLEFDFKSQIKFAGKLLIALGILFSIFFLIKGNWFLPLFFAIIGLIMLVNFKLKGKKEINLFTDKILEFRKYESA